MPDDVRVAAILGDWCDRCESGETIDPEAVIREHPDLAEELRDGFAALDAVDRIFGELPEVSRTVPNSIGSYRVLRRLGAGGMGTVFLAENESGSQVALKVVHPHLLERRGFFKRFLREAELGRRVKHENVVRTLDVDAVKAGAETTHFLVVEYVQGRTLRHLLDDLGSVPESLLREIATQAAAGLRAIHEAGIVHRDLKPENLLITDDHRVRIMDLGVARGVDASVVLTREGQFAGSLLYAAPEQFKKGAIGPAADLYSLGVLLFELTTGEHPFPADDAAGVMNAHLEAEAPRSNERNPGISPFFTEVVATLLRKDPALRFGSSEALLKVLVDGEKSRWWIDRERAVLATAPTGPRVPVRRETPLYGREEDLQLLHQAWAAAQDGGGNALLLEGEAGIGKTRLVDAFLAGLDGSAATVLYGSYPPSGGLGGLSDAMLEHFGAAELEEALAPYLQVTPRLVPTFAALLKHEAMPEGGVPLQGDTLHSVFVNLMHALSEERPLLWIIEDLHFARSDSRRVLLSLARALEGSPILLVLTTRPELPEDELALFSRLESFRRTRLGRLSAREVILLLQSAFRSQALAEKLGGKIALKSDGIPFFVFEMIRGLKEGQFITELPDGSYVETQRIEEIEVPSAVRDLIEVRLKDLSREDRALLEVGAVQGYEFDPGLTAEVLERALIPVLQALADLERCSGIVRARGARYFFDHHQIQEVVYSDLPQRLRQAYHARLAEVVAGRVQVGPPSSVVVAGEPAYLLAHHHLRGTEPALAEPFLAPALEHLERSYRHEAALEMAEAALAVPGHLDPGSRVRVLAAKGRHHRTLGNLDLVEQAAREGIAVAKQIAKPDLLRAAHHDLGSSLSRQSRWDEAAKHFGIAMRLARIDGDANQEARIEADTASMWLTCGRHEDAREMLERIIPVHHAAGDRAAEASARHVLGNVLLHLCAYEQAQAEYERAITMRQLLEDLDGEAASTINLGILLAARRRRAEAESCYERGLELARQCGNRLWEANVTTCIAVAASNLGRHAEYHEHQERALVLHREVGNLWGEAGAHRNLCLHGAALGAEGLARDHGERAIRLAREIGDPALEARVLGAMGAVVDMFDGPQAARDWYERGLRAARRSRAPSAIADALLQLSCIPVEAGGTDTAAPQAEEALELARKHGLPRPLIHAECVLAQMPGGRPEAALAAFREHGARLERSERVPALFDLWKIAGDPAHLGEARRLVLGIRDDAPEEYRESMLKNVRLNREIMEAWEEHGEEA